MKLSKSINQRKSVIFLHIPKAAGSTLNKIVEKQYDSNTVFKIKGNCPQESINEFKKFTEAERKKIRLVSGHTPFGLHEFLPQPSTYITMLRDPVERIISSYFFVLQTPCHYLHEEVTSSNMSLKEYVCSGISTEIDNGQVRLLAAANAKKKDVGFGHCSVEMLELAKKNLKENFAVVGLVERFDETLLLLKKTLGWRNLFYVKHNVTKNLHFQQEISKDTLNLIKKQNNLDIELYKYVREFFDLQVQRQTDSFQKELKLFKLLNNSYQKIYPLYDLPRTANNKVQRKLQRLFEITRTSKFYFLR